MEIETPVLLAYAIEDSTDIFRISGGGGWTPQTLPSVRHWHQLCGSECDVTELDCCGLADGSQVGIMACQ